MEWSQIRTTLLQEYNADLVALIKALYQLSPENRDFLEARFAQGIDRQEALRAYKRRIEEIFFPERGFPEKLDLRAGRKAINQYKKATGDFHGTLDLMLVYVESGTEFINQYGDIDERFYNSLSSVLGEIAELLEDAEGGAVIYALFRDRFLTLERAARHIGWGYGDFVHEIVGELEAMFDFS